MDIQSCMAARYDAGICKHNKERTGVVEIYKIKQVIGDVMNKKITMHEEDKLDVCQIGNLHFEADRNKNQGRVYEKNGLSHTLTDMQGGGRQPHIVDIKKVVQTVDMRGRGSDNQQQLELGSREYINTLTSVQKDNLILKIENTSIEQIEPEFYDFIYEINGEIYLIRIRKLTPKECWSLMDFNEGSFEKAEKVNSATQLYKQAGNSIVVNCLVGIFGQLIEGKEDVYKNR